ncbi:OmpA-OmpF porin, OOP family [Streptoalloteichus tenebrarius]|uniref:OmpA-OmpF porin, OOP family n=1 Tax=Streptoalloteichus tenebrarius (strain ATCC 17920 / DSM 40477 / JCM 4838 / CBS 697.72 / NBRC 16177 / NCIMB 11028 / NRRL B-12390 / A12253. 1 / ISP 5477) TaxID=1933 RepID=A0ABT1HXZ6_STRSD|nr:OmpA family protein [Streptoalloteichus tenebrarius]MCP2260392.1 OmpA-OmpF porin, OOP family [Streptoalloteichus tenebrarius]
MGKPPHSDRDRDGEDQLQWRRRRGDRAAWVGWLLAAVLCPAAVAGAATATTGQRVQRELTERASHALRVAGVGGRVSFDGRDGEVVDVPAGRGEQARQVVQAVDGVRSVRVSEAAPVAPPPRTQVEPVTMTFTGDRVAVMGAVPDETARDEVLAAVEHACGRAVVPGLQVVSSAPMPGPPAAFGELARAASTVPGERTVSWTLLGVTLTGTVPDPTSRGRIEEAVRHALPGVEVHSQLVVTRDGSAQALETGATQEQLDRMLIEHPITFLPNSAVLTAEGAESVRQVAQLLRGVSDRTVEVGGHVAAGPGGESNALRLSQQRADAVRDKLVRQGLPAERIVAKGFGDARPRADNNSQEGKAANRRVEITVR